MKDRGTYLLAASGGLAVLIAIVLIVVGVNTNEGEIAKRPTKDQLLAALILERESDRHTCRLLNRRFRPFYRDALENPPEKLAYFREHPAEQEKLRQRYEETLAAMRPVNCLRENPVPTLRDLEGRDAAARGAATPQASP